MAKKDAFTKILAIAGTALVWLPILTPIFFTAVFLLAKHVFRFDFLMPAELFLVALAGGMLLIWAAIRARSPRGLVGWSLGVAGLCLVGGQALGVVTGLASGKTSPGGWQWALVLASLLVYTLALVAIGVGGVVLLRDVFRPSWDEK
jgi:hypothetical protein